MKNIFFLILLMLRPFAASGTEDCPSRQTIAGKYVLNQFFTITYGCLLQVTPLEKHAQIYREYYFDERGQFLIFNSLTGSYESSTGMRSYFLFPRRQSPDYLSQQDGKIRITLPTGGQIIFSAGTMGIQGFPGVNFSESKTVSLEDAGGVEIEKPPGLLLDNGWKVGARSYHDPNGHSTFRDGRGASCAVANHEIFNYQDAIYDEPLLAYQSDAGLAAFLQQRCPTLDLSSLLWQR